MFGNDLLAKRTQGMGVSAIREILKVVAQPGMVSLAGGIPAPESFPLELMGELTETVIRKYGPNVFQYDNTEGFGPLREILVDHLAQKGIVTGAKEILIANGSQGVLNALGMAVISKGDRVAVEAPTYLGALQAFTPYEPEYVRLETDADGVIPESMESVLKTGSIKLIYLVPTFQNPTGRSVPIERRRMIADLAQRYNVLVVEDDPYSDLRFRGELIPSIQSLAPSHVIYIGTLSKVFAPGLRLGFCVAPELLRRWLIIVKQGIDLHTSTFNQALAAEYLSGGHLKTHLPRIIELYRTRQEAMLTAMDAHFPSACRWTRPDGGMFVWVQGPKTADMEAFYWKAVEHKVAFVPGKFFFAHSGEGQETMRLNFTNADEKNLSKAVERLAQILHNHLKE